MSQHQTGVPVKRLKQTAMTWKVKDKATSQLARSQWRKSERTGRDCSPKVLTTGTAVLTPRKVQTSGDSAGSCFVRYQKGLSHFIILKQSVLSSSSTYIIMTSVGSRGAGLPHKNIIKKLVPFHFKIMIHAHAHTHILTYYGISVCMDTYMLEYY